MKTLFNTLILALVLVSFQCLERDIPEQCWGQVNVIADPISEQCLTTVVWGEARSENIKSKIAVAWSVINRSRLSGRSTCAEVVRPHQYSVFSWQPKLLMRVASVDPSSPIDNVIEKKAWEESRAVAQMVLAGLVTDPTNGATHYLAPKIMKVKHWKFPTWAKKFKPTVMVGSHQFYMARTG